MRRIKIILAAVAAMMTMLALSAPAMAQSSLEFSPSSGDLDISDGGCGGVILGDGFRAFRVSSGDVDDDFCDNDGGVGQGGILGPGFSGGSVELGGG